MAFPSLAPHPDLVELPFRSRRSGIHAKPHDITKANNPSKRTGHLIHLRQPESHQNTLYGCSNDQHPPKVTMQEGPNLP